MVGVKLADLGDLGGGVGLLREARRIAEEQADVEGLAMACIMMTWGTFDAGRLEEGLAAALDGAEATGRLGSPGWRDFLEQLAAQFEFPLGRWEEADRHLRAVLERDQLTGPKGVHTRWQRARLDIARGDFAAARRWLQEAEQQAATASRAQFDAQFAGPLATARAELALWEGRDHDAFQASTEGLTALAHTVADEGADSVLFALGLAAAANKAERASARRATNQAEDARRDGDQLLARLQALADAHTSFAMTPAVLAQCRAEHSRLHGHPNPTGWAATAAEWEALGQPYPAACAHWREAEALLATRASKARTEQVLGAAYAVAVRLGATPLRRELELLAQRGRARLEPPARPVVEPEAPSAAASLGLTTREAEVLALLAEGRTNRQIGETLFITPKTASVHVSRILAKLGVAGRGEAAAVAHRLGLDKP
jgi:DNA-binding CsgD family transcriptional regulator